jgi:hypothetical protein
MKWITIIKCTSSTISSSLGAQHVPQGGSRQQPRRMAVKLEHDCVGFFRQKQGEEAICTKHNVTLSSPPFCQKNRALGFWLKQF